MDAGKKLHFFICLRQIKWWFSSHISKLAGKLTSIIFFGGLLSTSLGIIQESQGIRGLPKEVSCRWSLFVSLIQLTWWALCGSRVLIYLWYPLSGCTSQAPESNSVLRSAIPFLFMRKKSPHRGSFFSGSSVLNFYEPWVHQKSHVQMPHKAMQVKSWV